MSRVLYPIVSLAVSDHAQGSRFDSPCVAVIVGQSDGRCARIRFPDRSGLVASQEIPFRNDDEYVMV